MGVKQGWWAEAGRSVGAEKEEAWRDASGTRQKSIHLEPEPLPERETTTTTILSAYSSGVAKFWTSSSAEHSAGSRGAGASRGRVR